MHKNFATNLYLLGSFFLKFSINNVKSKKINNCVLLNNNTEYLFAIEIEKTQIMLNKV